MNRANLVIGMRHNVNYRRIFNVQYQLLSVGTNNNTRCSSIGSVSIHISAEVASMQLDVYCFMLIYE